MKSFIFILLLGGALASCAPSGKPPVDPLNDEAQHRRITELESQLDLQRHRNDRWQIITVGLCIGSVVLLILGTSLGAKTRHDAALS